jgi:hypothetical protein
VGQECIINIGLVDPRFMIDELYMPAISSSLDVLGYSYVDNVSGINVFGSDSSKRIYVNTAKWGNLSSYSQVFSESKIVVINVKVVGVDTNVATGALTATADISKLPGFIGSNICTIDNAPSGNCQIIFEYNPSLPSGLYSIPISLSANGQASTLKLKNIVTFTLP